MKIVTYLSGKELRAGLRCGGDRILDIATVFGRAQDAGLVAASMMPPTSVLDIVSGGPTMSQACNDVLSAVKANDLDFVGVKAVDATLVAPIPRPTKNVFCVGSNYRAHVTEASRAQEKQYKVPKLPVFFTKPPTAVVGPNQSVLMDPAVSEKMDYEVELAVIIGTPGRNINAANAINHIFGFSIANDVTARDLQRAHGGQYLKGKGLDTSCPFGPEIVTLDELANFENLRISLSVNGELRQDGNTKDMIFSIPRLIESLSLGLTLEPGDILITGTPSGVGYAMEPPQWLQDGDVVTCEIEGIGTLTNTIQNTGSSQSA
ncbi:fumarylacetoacetate hydrolase family protein [Parasedimentitalea marina]|uniref:fumarylacetoacetate hydrolase family protein n=1 Tax=Parasedimentitalea marina TaxID=2483033 RepID=UPI001EE7BDA2|nr:fumarylacetoacetate hydrolase family protein [Parasedimentitalea marina]